MLTVLGLTFLILNNKLHFVVVYPSIWVSLVAQ